MNIFSIIGFAIVACILSVVMKEYKPEYSVAINILAGVVIFGIVLAQSLPVFDALFGMFERANLSSEYAVVLFKSLGICFVTQLASDICRDSGHTAVASKVELAGKVGVLLLALPLFSHLLDIIYQLIFGV